MSNYSQLTSFTPKDSLPSGNPSKVIRGSEFDGEFNAISVAIATKADTSTVSSLTTTVSDLSTEVDTKQDTLVSGTNIKTINGSSVLGSGDLVLSAGDVTGPASTTDNTIARYDGGTGKLLQSSSATLDDAGGFAGVKSINGGQLAGLRNKIINGNFGINQRSYVSGAATTAGQYVFDRWKVTGTAALTFSTTANKTTVTIPSGQTLQQVIEGLNLETATYVLSWGGTAQGRINGGVYGASGSVTASLTGGTNATIEFNTGTVERVQLEVGSVATPFEHRPYGMELELCRRYYQELCTPGIASQYVIGTGMMTSTTSGNIPVVLSPAMRSTPTVSLSAGSDFVMYAGTGTGVVSTFPILGQSSKDQICLGPTTGTPLTNGAALIVYTANANGRLGLVAEF